MKNNQNWIQILQIMSDVIHERSCYDSSENIWSQSATSVLRMASIFVVIWFLEYSFSFR